MWPELVIRAVNELKRHFLLWRERNARSGGGLPHRDTRVPRAVGAARGAGKSPARPAAHLVLVPPIQVPVQDHSGSLPLPDLQEDRGWGGGGEGAGLGWWQGAGSGPGAQAAPPPPSQRPSDSPHRAMKMAKSTVPSLSKR